MAKAKITELYAASKNGLDIEGYRERVAAAVSISVSELLAEKRDDPNLVMKRMVASYFLFAKDHLLPTDIGKIVNRSESAVRYSVGYIERRTSHYYAFKVYIDQAMATYALASN